MAGGGSSPYAGRSTVNLNPIYHDPTIWRTDQSGRQYRVSTEWDFEASDVREWLDDNCTSEWDYTWGDENEDDTMQLTVHFKDATDCMAFKLRWEEYDTK